MNTKKIVLTVVIALLVIIFGFSSFYTISSTQRGILTTFGKVSSKSIGDGLHAKIPFIQNVKKVNVQTQKIDDNTISYTKDIQSAELSFVVNYDFQLDNLVDLYTKVGFNYETKILSPIIEGVIKDVVGTFNAAEIVENRDNVRNKIEIQLINKFPSQYFSNIRFQIVNIDYDDQFEKAIIEKQVAEQNALREKNNTVRIQEEANQQIIKAEAEAKAIQIKADALAANPKIVSYEAVQRWNGALPEYMLGDAVPFINLK